MNIGWPEGIVLTLLVLNIGLAMGKHGQPKEPWSAPAAMIGVAIHLALLWWGGFFA